MKFRRVLDVYMVALTLFFIASDIWARKLVKELLPD